MLNKTATGYEAYTEFRARRDEKAYRILNNAAATVLLGHAAGHYTLEVAKAVQIDCMTAQLAIDVARQTEGI